MLSPSLIYGTAWKGPRTASLVTAALNAGFRAIDTACQPKHYNESGTGEGWVASGLPRASLFLQTKFTPLDGQDCAKPLPYDRAAPLAKQVQQSYMTSLANLRTTYIDSLLLHSPMPTHAETLSVWRAFESLHSSGAVRSLGISNIYDARALERLYAEAVVKPSCVQNRFHAQSGYDTEVRAFCRAHGIAYQSFWTLTANPRLLASPLVARLAAAREGTPAQVLFRLVAQAGITPLSGTCDAGHMRDDVAALTWPPFAAAEIAAFEELLRAECDE